MAAESKAHEKVWYPVTNDVGIATVMAPTTTVPARTVTSSGPTGPEERTEQERSAERGRAAATADGGRA
eukprot:3474139-Alexandrium_andersonii.AAC.1